MYLNSIPPIRSQSLGLWLILDIRKKLRLKLFTKNEKSISFSRKRLGEVYDSWPKFYKHPACWDHVIYIVAPLVCLAKALNSRCNFCHRLYLGRTSHNPYPYNYHRGLYCLVALG